jgi:hypothetical protein
MTQHTETMPPAKPGSFVPPSHEVEARIQELRVESQSTDDRAQKAALLYEIAHLEETVLLNSGRAVQSYLAAYNADSRMRLSLYALLRMFERKRSHKNLQRLYDAELRSARTPLERATALIDQGVLATVAGSDLEVARARFEQALEHEPESLDALLLLEWNRRAVNDETRAAQALFRRAQFTDDPVLRGTLLLEVAALREAAGDVGSALEALKKAALEGARHEGFLIALSRFARQHGQTQELVEATERHAQLLEDDAASAVASESEVPTTAQLKARAVALWYEAARLRCGTLGDAEGALTCLAKAMALRPDDILLRQTRMLAYDMLEDRERAAQQAAQLLTEGVTGEHAAALHFRLAENALVRGELDSARTSMMEAIAQAGGSVAADTMLDDLLLDEERHRERIERREARAAAADPARSSRWLLEAAMIAAHELRDQPQSSALFRRALSKAKGSPDLLREAYGAAIDVQDDETARLAIDGLLALSVDDDEWASFVHHRAELSNGEATEVLGKYLDDPRGRHLLPHLSRQHAAENKDYALLARAHSTLADAVVRSEDAVAHLCAAARAALRGNEAAQAEVFLRKAIERAPNNRYAVTLLEEALRSRGENEELVQLLRKTAEAQTGAHAELSLLLAGAAAEAASDSKHAAQAYEEAADRNPKSVGPLWALLRLGERTSDAALELSAREGLAAREQSDARASIETLLLAEHYDLVSDKPELAEQNLLATLEDPAVGHHAAAALLILRGAAADKRKRALATLRDRAGDSSAAFVRAMGQEASLHESQSTETREAVEQVLAAAPKDRWALYTQTTDSQQAPLDHGMRLEALAAALKDPNLRDASRAAAIHARLLGEGKFDVEAAIEGDFGPAVARQVANFTKVNEARQRARALSVRAEHVSDEERTDTLHALTRARLLAGDAKGACEAAREALTIDAQDLTALEALRVAARRAGGFREVADACDKLAEHVQGDLWAQLLEEGAALRMDLLDDYEGALIRLRRVHEAYPARSITYGRLHDLVAQTNDPQALIDLVQDRTEQIDDAGELARLFYELARLYRAGGDLESALAAIDNLLMLEEHVGGRALAVEIHSARGNFVEAVEALRALAVCEDVPKAHKRLARLGAADFLENRLKDADGALDELQKLDDEGQGDLVLYLRMADVAERTNKLERASQALDKASALARGDQKIDVLLRAASLYADKLGRHRDAENAYERVLSLRPGHADAALKFAAFTKDDARREQVLGRFEAEVRAECQAHPLDGDALRKLLTIANLRVQPDVEFIALSALSALGLANLSERDATDVAVRKMLGARVDAASALDANALRELLIPAADDKCLALTHTLFSAAAEIDHLEPGKFGVGRAQKVSPRETNHVREEVNAMMLALGLKPSEFYVGGDEATRALAMPHEGECGFVVGVGVTAPLSTMRRHQVALQLSAAYLKTTPLIARSPAQSLRLVLAALAVADCPLPSNVSRDTLSDEMKLLSKQLPRRVRKSLTELGRSLGEDTERLERHLRIQARHTRRLALLLGGDLGASLESLLGPLPKKEAIANSEDALDLVRAWTSAAMATLRRRVGLVR